MKGLRGSVTNACKGWVTMGRSRSTIRAIEELHPAVALTTVSASTLPSEVSTPVTRPFSRVIAVTSVKRMDLCPLPGGPSPEAPHDGVVPDDSSGRVVQRTDYRQESCPLGDPIAGTSSLISLGPTMRLSTPSSRLISALCRRP